MCIGMERSRGERLMSLSRRLAGIIEMDVTFENLSGLLIRMPVHAQMFRVGGADQYPMITSRKYSAPDGSEETREVPLIPGSSIKGRMRGLLELALGKKLYSTDGKIWQHVRSVKAMSESPNDFLQDIAERCEIDDLFGWAAANLSQIMRVVGNAGRGSYEEKETLKEALKYFNELAPTRLLVDDFTPSDEFLRSRWEEFESIADFIEEKSENRIDRITSAADPRQIARIKPGIEFSGKLRILVFDIDRDHVKKYLTTLALGMKLLEETYLGASGSRGYGRIKFRKIELNLIMFSPEKGVMIKSLVDKPFTSVDEFMNEVVKGALPDKVVKALFSTSEA